MHDQVTSRQAVCMLILFELGSSLVTGGSMKAEQDSWITALIGLGMSVPLLFLYASMQKRCPTGDFYDMACQAFGKAAIGEYPKIGYPSCPCSPTRHHRNPGPGAIRPHLTITTTGRA